MDELERNDLLSEDAEAESTAEAPIEAEEVKAEAEASEEEKLREELEDLKDLFQSELDKALSGEEAASEDMLIQELEEEPETEEEEEEKEVRLCEYCGQNPADTSYGEDYPYCSECRKLMKANPLNAIGVLVLLVVLLVTGYSFGNMAKNIDTYITLLDADTAYTSRALTDAANYYQTYLASATEENISLKAARNAAYTMADLGYYSDAKTIIDTYFSEDLDKKSNKKLAEINAEYDILMRTSDLINENFGEALNGAEFDYEEEIEKADKLIEEYKDNAEYNYTFLEYGKYLIMLIDGKDDEILIKQLQKIEEIDGGKHPWIYLTYLLNTYGNLGDTEKAKEVFDRCLEINTQEISLYNYYANAYRFCESPDADKILEIAEEASKHGSSSSYPVYYRSYALAYLLKGENELALESISKYLSSCQPTVADFNLYAICAIANGDDETYKEAKSTLESYGYELSDTVKNCKKGKLTVLEAITDKEGQI